jgi:uncharacterized protein YqeY
MAEVKDRLRTDLMTAMKAQDGFTTGVLRMALAAIGNEQVAGAQARELSLAEEYAVVTREVRKRRESAEIYSSADRGELADKERREAEVLSAYIPAPLGEAELDAIVTEEVNAVDGATIRQMGQIIKAVNVRVQGRADGSIVAAKVRAALNA